MSTWTVLIQNNYCTVLACWASFTSTVGSFDRFTLVESERLILRLHPFCLKKRVSQDWPITDKVRLQWRTWDEFVKAFPSKLCIGYRHKAISGLYNTPKCIVLFGFCANKKLYQIFSFYKETTILLKRLETRCRILNEIKGELLVRFLPKKSWEYNWISGVFFRRIMKI